MLVGFVTRRNSYRSAVFVLTLFGALVHPPAARAQAGPDAYSGTAGGDKPFVCSAAGEVAPHCHPLPATDFVWLLGRQGRPASDVAVDPHYASLIADLVPMATFRYGYDMPLGQAFKTMLNGSNVPMAVRAGRYAMLSTRTDASTARGLLWIDLQLGVGFGVIFSHPTTGEPSPSELIFSRQFSDNVLQEPQLPQAFLVDLSKWEAANRIPAAARYFISSNGRSVLLHARDWCAQPGLQADTLSDASTEVCRRLNEQAAEADLAATYYLALKRYADAPSTRADLQTTQQKWLASRASACPDGPEGTECRVQMTRARAQTLQHFYTVALDN